MQTRYVNSYGIVGQICCSIILTREHKTKPLKSEVAPQLLL